MSTSEARVVELFLESSQEARSDRLTRWTEQWAREGAPFSSCLSALLEASRTSPVRLQQIDTTVSTTLVSLMLEQPGTRASIGAAVAAARAIALQQEAEASSLTRNLYQLVFEDPCEEIDLILRDCLLASQTEGNPDCFDAATPAESDECWCQTCDFERAITICRQPSIYQQCAPCQMGRTPRAWGSARCRDGRRFPR